MTVEDIRSVTFETVRKGYRTEDVDDYLQQVAADMERLIAERNTALNARNSDGPEMQSLKAAKEDAENKMFILAEKVEEYRGMEETLTTALINAQRMGETVVKEAKQKAEQMLREATGQTELLRQKAEQEIGQERSTLENLTAEVTRFKTTILNLYKQHIESLSALDPPVARAEETLDKVRPEQEPEEPEAAIVEEEELVEEPASAFGAAEPELPAPSAPKPLGGEMFEGVPLDGEN